MILTAGVLHHGQRMTSDSYATVELSRLVAAAEFRSIPPEVIDVAKTVTLNGFAITLAGSITWRRQTPTIWQT